jgi:hypothetical protein
MVMSSVISKLREPMPDYLENRELIEKYLKMSINLYYRLYEYLDKSKPDLLYIFNGRYAVVRPALRAATKLGIKTLVHERSGIIENYSLTENTLPHDLEYFKAKVEKKWSLESDFPLKKRIAEDWFAGKRNRIEKSWYSFVADQKKNKLPDNFAKEKRNIVIFNSSEDEMEGLSAIWHETFYKSSDEVINKILAEFKNEEFHFYIRIHPNLKGILNSQTKKLAALNYQNLTVLEAEDNIDSYALIDACEKLITFNSTTGLEGNFWDKPVILLGHSYYEDLGVSYRPQSYDELFDLIQSYLPPMDKTGSLKFGYYMQTYGNKYQFFKPKDLFYGTILGQDLTTNPQLQNQQELFEIVEDYLNTNIFLDFKPSTELVSIIVNNPGIKSLPIVETVLQQKYPNREIIFCGDKSVDFTEKSAIRFEQGNLSNALKTATGKYVLLLDCDKVLFSRTLNYFINNLMAFTNDTKLIYSDFIRWKTETGMYEPVPENYDSGNSENIFSGLLFFEKAVLSKELENHSGTGNFLTYFLSKYRSHKIELPLACQLDNITRLTFYYNRFNQAESTDNIIECGNILNEIKNTGSPDSTLYFRYGCLLFKNNKFSKAIPEFSEALRLGLKNRTVYNNLAFCLEKTGDKKTAEILRQKANIP